MLLTNRKANRQTAVKTVSHQKWQWRYYC